MYGPVLRILCPTHSLSCKSNIVPIFWTNLEFFLSLAKTFCSISFPPVPKRSSTNRLMIPATNYPVAGLPPMGSSFFSNAAFVLKKSNTATRQTLTPIGLERVFQRSTQALDSPLAAKMSKSQPRVPWSNMQHWKCMFGKTWHRRIAIRGEMFGAISDGFPWRINCCPGPKESHLLIAYWTSAVRPR